MMRIVGKMIGMHHPRTSVVLVAATMATLAAAMVALLAFAASPAQGVATLPSGFQQKQVVGGLTNPMDIELASNGRLFVVEQRGVLRVLRPNGKLETFLDISAKVDSTGERGLLGVALDPNFSTNNFVYLYYTQKAEVTTPAHNRVVRVTAGSNDRAKASSETLIFRLDNQTNTYHQGGAIDFGNDGKLHLTTGDNFWAPTSPEVERNRPQQLSNLFGKVLRINKDGTIPTDNPFYTTTSGNNRAIWALGLRNPFKFAIRPGAGTIFINDVGQDSWEEIDRGAKGANYGWPINEGPTSDPVYTTPIFEYGHGSTNTTGCAITGGAFYDPGTVTFPSEYVGDYFFADLCSGWVQRYDSATDTATGFATGLSSPVDLEVTKAGSLYYLSRAGTVSEISYTGGTGATTATKVATPPAEEAPDTSQDEAP